MGQQLTYALNRITEAGGEILHCSTQVYYDQSVGAAMWIGHVVARVAGNPLAGDEAQFTWQ